MRDVPEDVVAALEARAAKLGLSRSEYLRRRLAQEAVIGTVVTAADLVSFSTACASRVFSFGRVPRACVVRCGGASFMHLPECRPASANRHGVHQAALAPLVVETREPSMPRV